MLEFMIGGMIGTIAGFLMAAIIGAGKIDALDRKNWTLSVEIWDLNKKLERVKAEAHEKWRVD